MFFCKKCRYLFNVTKDVKSKQIGGRINEALSKIFDKIGNNEQLVEKDLRKIKGKMLVEDERFEAMNKKDQRKLMSSIKTIDKNFFMEEEPESEGKVGTNAAFFICKFCKYNEPIPPGTAIYSKNYSTTDSAETDDYTYAVNDQTLPRTRNYICKNPNCETHKKIDLREAVITKNQNEQVVYICTVCLTNWINSL